MGKIKLGANLINNIARDYLLHKATNLKNKKIIKNLISVASFTIMAKNKNAMLYKPCFLKTNK